MRVATVACCLSGQTAAWHAWAQKNCSAPAVFKLIFRSAGAETKSGLGPMACYIGALSHFCLCMLRVALCQCTL